MITTRTWTILRNAERWAEVESFTDGTFNVAYLGFDNHRFGCTTDPAKVLQHLTASG